LSILMIHAVFKAPPLPTINVALPFFSMAPAWSRE